MNATAWSRGLEVTGGGTGVVSHAGLVLLRQLADRTGLTAGLSAALPAPDGGLDRGRVFADLACAIADGARVISDFRVMGDQGGVFGQAASVPTAWRTLREAAAGGDKARRKITAAVNKARRYAWPQVTARHGELPPVQVADRQLTGITCIRLDATVVFAHSGKELAEPNFKGFGHHPLLAECGSMREPLAWMMRPGSAGSSTAADHLKLVDEAIAALPPQFRRKLMVTCDGAGASHDLVKRLDKLASRRGCELTYSVGRALTGREKTALRLVPETAWEAAADAKGEVRERRSDEACANGGCGHRGCWIEEAHVTELTGLLRKGPDGDRLKAWPKTIRVFARRERPHPGAQLTLFEAEDGWRYTLRATNLPEDTRGWRGQCAYIDAGHRVHARVEDVIRTGKDTGLGHFPSRDYGLNKAWLDASVTACILLSWLRHLALDGKLAKAEPKTLRYRLFHTAARLVRGGRRKILRSPPPGPGPRRPSPPGTASRPSRTPPDQRNPSLLPRKEPPGACGTPATRPGSRAVSMPRHRKPLPEAPVAPFRQTPQQREKSRLATLPWRQVPVAYQACKRGHGRTERRTLKVTAVAKGLAFPHAARAIQITRRRKLKGKWSRETCYAVTSLSVTQASHTQLAAIIRGHWGIENF